MLSLTVSFELPIFIIKWTRLQFLQPSRDTVKMECMITGSPCDIALFFAASLTISLTVNTKIHKMRPANTTVVLFTFPFPHGYGIPFFNCKLFLGAAIDLHFFNI